MQVNQPSSGICVAMWSGPRNISTAMMRAWENRRDCNVMDEPFYAYYLQQTGIDHPMRDAIIAHHEPQFERVVEHITTAPATGVFYQKHISTHVLPEMNLDWIKPLKHLFLIRDPQYMVASYQVKRAAATASDFGYEQLLSVFEKVKTQSGSIPMVIDSQRFLEKPREHLMAMCDYVAIPFDEAMLSWPKGTRDSDGIWHEHWYDAVKQSTGFGPARSSNSIQLTQQQQATVDSCMPYYQQLNQVALQL